jgi:NADPH2:quinone reductase
MRVIQAARFGGPEVLVPGWAPDPEAGSGQVVVGVSVAALDFVQTQLRQGFTPKASITRVAVCAGCLDPASKAACAPGHEENSPSTRSSGG